MVSFGVGTHYKTFNVYCDGVTRLFSTRLCNSPNDEIEGHDLFVVDGANQRNRELRSWPHEDGHLPPLRPATGAPARALRAKDPFPPVTDHRLPRQEDAPCLNAPQAAECKAGGGDGLAATRPRDKTPVPHQAGTVTIGARPRRRPLPTSPPLCTSHPGSHHAHLRTASPRLVPAEPPGPPAIPPDGLADAPTASPAAVLQRPPPKRPQTPLLRSPRTLPRVPQTLPLPLPARGSPPASGSSCGPARHPTAQPGAARPAGPTGIRPLGPEVLRPGARPRRERGRARQLREGAERYLRVDVAHRVVLDLPEHLLGNFGRRVRHGRGGSRPAPRGPLPNRAARPRTVSRTRSPTRPGGRSAGAARALRDAPSCPQPRGSAEQPAARRRRPAPRPHPAAPRARGPPSPLRGRGVPRPPLLPQGTPGPLGSAPPRGPEWAGPGKGGKRRGPSRQHARPLRGRMREARGGAIAGWRRPAAAGSWERVPVSVRSAGPQAALTAAPSAGIPAKSRFHVNASETGAGKETFQNSVAARQ